MGATARERGSGCDQTVRESSGREEEEEEEETGLFVPVMRGEGG